MGNVEFHQEVEVGVGGAARSGEVVADNDGVDVAEQPFPVAGGCPYWKHPPPISRGR